MTIHQETAIGATGSTQVMSKVNILQLSWLEIPVRLIVILSRLTHATNVERCLSLKIYTSVISTTICGTACAWYHLTGRDIFGRIAWRTRHTHDSQ